MVKQSAEGYTKAADLWSLGCLAAILLTGEPLFDDLPRDLEEGYRLEAIKKLKVRMERLKVGERAQDFVFRLLQHDASKRMNVKQALRHEWFTNASHKADFEALYCRSIRDWKPRTTTEPRIVGLESYIKSHSSRHSQGSSNSDHDGLSLKSGTCSQRTSLPTSTNETDDEHSGRPPSETLSEVILVPQQNVTSGYFPQRSQDKNNAPSTPTVLPSENAASNAVRQREHSRKEGKRRLPSDVSNTQDSYTTSQGLATPRSSESVRIRAVVEAAMSAGHSHGTKSKSKRLRRESDELEDEDQVYEEVKNPVTGKRQQLLYGVRV